MVLQRAASAQWSLWVLVFFAAAAQGAPFPGCVGGTLVGCPGTANCSRHWLEVPLDHFNWAAPLGNQSHRSFQMRYFVNQQWWRPGGPVFFYFGNEDNVELYVNHTGLMWESAGKFGAMLVWAEHRYYGQSIPFGPNTAGCMSWLTSEQAMADFAYMIDHLRIAWGAAKSAFIGFGGSYGGMLAAWFRVHYPNAIDGVIAASAPIWSFEGLDPAYNYNAFNLGVTFDASTAGGSTDTCKLGLKAAWPRIMAAGQTASGCAVLTEAFRSCEPVQPGSGGRNQASGIIQWAEAVWGTMAMGNYPYQSSYLLHGESLLPAWPVRAACKHFDGLDLASVSDLQLFEAVREAAATVYNNTGQARCFGVTGTSEPMRSFSRMGARRFGTGSGPGQCMGDWDYQWCTEMTQPFTQGTPDDMFYCPAGSNCSGWSPADQHCEYRWGVTPRPLWARIGLGGKRISGASNIVFSNGQQDPWHGGGVLTNLTDSVLAIVLPNGAHHIDLMFSDPADRAYPDIAWARRFEREQISRWVEQHKSRRQMHAEL